MDIFYTKVNYGVSYPIKLLISVKYILKLYSRFFLVNDIKNFTSNNVSKLRLFIILSFKLIT